MMEAILLDFASEHRQAFIKSENGFGWGVAKKTTSSSVTGCSPFPGREVCPVT